MNKVKYLIVTPVRDEEKYLETTIKTVLNQSILPIKWIFVDDNSKDRTVEIIKKYISRHSFIVLKQINQETQRLPGIGVMRAFEYGIGKEKIADYDFIVKLDADLEFNEKFFEHIFTEFEKNIKLGIASGLILERTGKPTSNNYKSHTYGNTKIYSRSCFEAILPIEKIKSWDLIDNIKANVAGFDTRIIYTEQAIHLKPMDSAIGKYKENYLKGYYSGYLRYNPIFNIVKTLQICFKKPIIIGGISYFLGYIWNIITNDKYNNVKAIQYLNNQQRKRLSDLFKLKLRNNSSLGGGGKNYY